MANSRFDTRRELATQEANAIGTTLLRIGFFPDTIQTELNSILKHYFEERIAFLAAESDIDKMLLHF
ncbi:hypothetical protein GCM10009119_04080 [Algoriphagus jejuensis]|uniref:Uncharacterized protein n=1 Tax=Algoriphagus jejuensis TaxID=419934 RepID=A0ABP3Y9L5_9BACT